MFEDLTFQFLDQPALQSNLDEDIGEYPRDRDLTKYISRGFVILDKPAGPTSHDVVATVKKILQVDKAGHAGTLDPGVSGVLPIGIADGTKILSVLSGAKKRYICNMKLHGPVEMDRLQTVLSEMTNQIYQFPPLKSNVVRRLRKRTIYSMELIDHQEDEYLLDIVCEAGTYIRTLCVDIGTILGTGGVMKELRRVTSAQFDESLTVTLHDLYDAYQDAVEGITEENIKQIIQPIEEILDIPRVIVRNNAVSSFSHGAQLAVPAILGYQQFRKGATVQVLTAKGELVGLGTTSMSSDQLDTSEEGFVIQPDRVIFDRNEYSV